MKLAVKYLASISIDVETHTLVATYNLPQEGGFLEYTGELPLHPQEGATTEVLTFAAELAEAVTAALAEPRKAQDCSTCVGTCCKTFDAVEVTVNDVLLLQTTGSDVKTLVEEYASATITGVVGQMKQFEKKRCVALTDEGTCRIYAYRPQACRDFSAVDCDLYEVDGKKKHRLKIIG